MSSSFSLNDSYDYLVARPDLVFSPQATTTALILIVSLGLLLARFISYNPLQRFAGVEEMVSFWGTQLVTRLGMGGGGEVDWTNGGQGLAGGAEDSQDELSASETSEGALSKGTGMAYYPGLLNAAGNLCFLNATLQSLSSSSLLTSYLSSLPLPTSTVAQSRVGPRDDFPVSTALLSLLNSLNTPNKRPPAPLRPVGLARALAGSSKERNKLLQSSEQQDAHELLGMVREAVEEEAARWEKQSVRSDGWAELIGMQSGSRGAKGKGRERRSPWAHLMSQRVQCMTCGYTRDVRHIEEEQVVLSVPPVSSTTLQHLLAETIKQDLLSDYACRRCSLSATYEKLLAQRDRLSATPDLAPPPAPLSPSGKFDLPPTPNAVSTTMTASRKARFKKTAKLVDKVKSLIAAGDFENELIEEKDGVKVERVRGIASKVIRFARTPDILSLHLNRSSHHGYSVKNTCQVLFPEYLDLSPYGDHYTGPTESQSTKDVYRLCSLVVHYGSHSFGHYVAYRRAPGSRVEIPGQQYESIFSLATSFTSTSSTPSLPTPFPTPSPPPASVSPTPPRRGPEWYRLSDETVTPTNLNEVLSANPFLLFYEKVSSLEALQREGGGRVERESSEGRGRIVESWEMRSETG